MPETHAARGWNNLGPRVRLKRRRTLANKILSIGGWVAGVERFACAQLILKQATGLADLQRLGGRARRARPTLSAARVERWCCRRVRLWVRRTGEMAIGRGAAFGRECGSCSGRFLATPGRGLTLQHGCQAKEGRELRVPMQHTMDHAAALSHDLAGNLQHFVHECFELHPQPAGACRLVRRAVTRRDRQQQGRPGFQSLVITHESWRFGECFRRGLSRNVGFMVIELGAVWPAVVRWG